MSPVEFPCISASERSGPKNASVLAEMGVSMGCSGISVFSRCHQASEDELFRHFETIAKSIGPDVPMLLYNNPGRTGYGISQDVVQRLAHEFRECRRHERQ
jgi:4-hydroxy-tetrahydrodipicolinate synthase